ncbi:hypothetical protein N7494_005941 [Penicillium frequentans]|uniref:Uncharacterized protein n=1 Tax=Penicillium frequentans TaxID=3151616 RepID=A0AAD6CY21_9EURO|nr:hypothetical protein N7494_005941 [Penicillium glabrum]
MSPSAFLLRRRVRDTVTCGSATYGTDRYTGSEYEEIRYSVGEEHKALKARVSGAMFVDIGEASGLMFK